MQQEGLSPLPDQRKHVISGSILLIFLLLCWGYALFFAPTESHQGDVYRIMYAHVPSAFAAFFCSFLLLLFSLSGLRGHASSLVYSKATAELGLLYTILTLVTGSIWGRPTWGVWWTWDARLTTTLILSLLYCGYLLLWSSLPAGSLRNKICPVLGILIAADVPVIYKSVTWWRTLHQPPGLIREGGESTMAGDIRNLLILCCLSGLLFCCWLIWQRAINLKLEEELHRLSLRHLQNQESS
ncbi:MAG: cytochrome c biogenesis protein CcsA [Deltaproteobacteria bacterium]|nr:cytochrome c biogenesis protein CcsA [Deltaproteobacteria bacterium]